MKKQNIFIVLLVLCLLTLTIGYSLFRTNVEVRGKTAALESLNVVFTRIGKIEEVGSQEASATISDDKKNVTINVPKLMYKGAYAEIPITIKNVGTLPARLESIVQYGIGNNSSILVTYDGIGVTDAVLNPCEERNFKVKVLWAFDLFNASSNYEFCIKFNYVQG